MTGKTEKVSIRITPHQDLVLSELSGALNTSYSMLIRTIIGAWITENEDYLYKIIDKKKIESDAAYKQTDKDKENIFGEE